jgi:hypothetical protein
MRTLPVAITLFALSAAVQATPVTYSFDLTIDQINGGSTPDPYYSNFQPGQSFHGTFTYDADTATSGFLGYRNTTSLEVLMHDTLVTTRYGYGDDGTVVSLNDSAPGGEDSYFLFEELPLVSGGYLADYQAEQFYMNLIDSDGTALSSNVPAPIDFTRFDSGSWNFWSWGNEALYSPILLYGTVANLREVPEPALLGLAALGFASIGVVRVFRRRRASGVTTALAQRSS